MKLFPDNSKKNWYTHQRPPKRFPLRIHFKVSGRDENGFSFENNAETVDVGPGGGCLVMNKDVRKGETLRLYGPNGSTFLVTVCWFKYDLLKDLRYIGFKLLEPTRGWVIANGGERRRDS